MPTPPHLTHRATPPLQQQLLNAVQTENVEMTRLLLHKGANPLYHGEIKFTDMVLRANSPEIARSLIQSVKNCASQSDYSIGHLFRWLMHQGFSLEKKLSMAGLLCESGIDVNLKTPDIGTPMIHMAKCGEPALVALLLDHGGKIEDALQGAIVKQKLENVRLILSRKEVNLHQLRFKTTGPEEEGYTPLEYFLRFNRGVNSNSVEIFELLLSVGYPTNTTLLSPYFGQLVEAASRLDFVSSALSVVFSTHPELYNSILIKAVYYSIYHKKLDIFRNLLNFATHPLREQDTLIEALELALSNRATKKSVENLEVIQLLLETGINLNQQKLVNGFRELIKHDDLVCIQLLVGHGLNVNFRQACFLGTALSKKKKNIFRYLLKMGADPDSALEPDNPDMTVLGYAMSIWKHLGEFDGDSDFLTLLLENGASSANNGLIDAILQQDRSPTERGTLQQEVIRSVATKVMLRGALSSELPIGLHEPATRIMQAINTLLRSMGSQERVSFSDSKVKVANDLLSMIAWLDRPFQIQKFKKLTELLSMWTVGKTPSEARSLPPEIAYLIVDNGYQAFQQTKKLDYLVKKFRFKEPKLISDMQGVVLQGKGSPLCVFKDIIFKHDWCAENNFMEVFLSGLLKKGQKTKAALRLIERGADVRAVAPAIKAVLFKESVDFMGYIARDELLFACLVSGLSTEEGLSHCGTDWLTTMPWYFEKERPCLIEARSNLKASVLDLADVIGINIRADHYSYLLYAIFQIVIPIHQAGKTITRENLERHFCLPTELKVGLCSVSPESYERLCQFGEKATIHYWKEGPFLMSEYLSVEASGDITIRP